MEIFPSYSRWLGFSRNISCLRESGDGEKNEYVPQGQFLMGAKIRVAVVRSPDQSQQPAGWIRRLAPSSGNLARSCDWSLALSFSQTISVLSLSLSLFLHHSFSPTPLYSRYQRVECVRRFLRADTPPVLSAYVATLCLAMVCRKQRGVYSHIYRHDWGNSTESTASAFFLLLLLLLVPPPHLYPAVPHSSLIMSARPFWALLFQLAALKVVPSRSNI